MLSDLVVALWLALIDGVVLAFVLLPSEAWRVLGFTFCRAKMDVLSF